MRDQNWSDRHKNLNLAKTIRVLDDVLLFIALESKCRARSRFACSNPVWIGFYWDRIHISIIHVYKNQWKSIKTAPNRASSGFSLIRAISYKKAPVYKKAPLIGDQNFSRGGFLKTQSEEMWRKWRKSEGKSAAGEKNRVLGAPQGRENIKNEGKSDKNRSKSAISEADFWSL